MNITSKLIITIFVNVIPSIVIPYILYKTVQLTEVESTMLGVMIWSIITLTEVYYQTSSLYEERKSELEIWKSESEFDLKLLNIRDAYRKILLGKKSSIDIFQSFFDERITEVEKKLLFTAERNELHLEQSHVVSINALLGSFDGKPEDTLRMIHFLEDNEFFFDMFAKQYFYSVYRLIQQRKIREVKRLMIYDNETQLRDLLSEKLFRFHSTNKNFSYKVMQREVFVNMLRDYRLDVPKDFGIYGNKYVYVAQVNNIENIVGFWLRNEQRINQFVSFFDVCWASPNAKLITTPEAQQKLTIDQLFEMPKVTSWTR